MLEGSPEPSRAYLRALVRGGAPPEHAGPDDDLDLADASLARAARYWVVVPLAYRIAGFIKTFIGFATANGTVGLPPVLIATVLAVVANTAAVAGVIRTGGLRAQAARRVLGFDLAVGVLLNVVIAAVSPASVQPFAVDVTWTWLVGGIAMWAGTFGLPASLWMLACAVPFRALLSLVGGLSPLQPLALNRSIGCLVALAVAMVVAAGILVLLGVGARFALEVGVRHGRAAERRRTKRIMHDSVLQTLEAMAVKASGDERHAVERLAELRSIAGAEAAGLRGHLAEPPPGKSRGLAVELADVAAEMARTGLRTQLVAADFADDRTLSQARRTAMCEAVREALRNAAKHAGTRHVVLRVEARDGGIAVVARDQGTGFDVRDRPPGFGISQSIVARLAEVGGHGTVDSQPGRGTRVTMWVPA